MRIELASLGLDRLALVGALTVLVGVAASGWMVVDLSKRGTAADKLAKDVQNMQLMLDGQPAASDGEPDAATVAERMGRYVSPVAAVPHLLDELSILANDNNLGNLELKYEEKVVDPASPDGPTLQSLGIVRSIVITVAFKAEYADAARFMGSAALLPRPLMVKKALLKREPPKVSGSVIFEGFLAAN